MVAELFQALRAAEEKKEAHLFSSKKVQRALNSWLSDGYILAWSLLQKTSICLWKSHENVFTQPALLFHQELKLLSISACGGVAAHIITKMLTHDFDYYYYVRQDNRKR